ncbi:hypothetical protein RRG08_009819 [Elysia crispata]|uniref:Uncharacterized protein n=1 Tax=Elysia crispata TaxID=231223 RepID=A0AAE0Z451_9GAST|nr:hypothetical protein RRG08_009819 [Elysia crispata]
MAKKVIQTITGNYSFAEVSVSYKLVNLYHISVLPIKLWDENSMDFNGNGKVNKQAGLSYTFIFKMTV